MRYLSIEEVNRLQTPFFLFDQEHLEFQVSKIRTAFNNNWNNYQISYSVKTNSLPYLSLFLLKMGLSAEVVSEDEYNLIKAIGYRNDRIICNGPIKEENWIFKILKERSFLNIDSKIELSYVKKYANIHPDQIVKIGLRVNIDIEDVFPNASTAGIVGSRFGFSYENEELSAAINTLEECSNIVISGLHLHISTKIRSLEIYQYITYKFVEIVNKYSLRNQIEYLDIGGGFYGEIDGKPNWTNYIKAITDVLLVNSYTSKGLKLIIEPGVSLLSGCFSYYTRVVDLKSTKRSNFILLDGSRIHIDPLMHKKTDSYFFKIMYQFTNKFEVERLQIFTGFTCLEYDTFFSLNISSKISIGDIVRFDKVGAYTITFSPLFISWFPRVYSFSSKGFKLVRDKWGTKDVLQKSILNL